MPIDHFPPRIRRPAEKLRRFLLTDATALIILGVSIIFRGISYIPTEVGGRVDTHPAEGFLPMEVWALVWIGVGILCITTAPWHDGKAAAVAIGLGIGLNIFWAGSFYTASITGEMPRAWVTGTGYAALAVAILWAVWRGKRVPLPVPSQEEIANELRRGDR